MNSVYQINKGVNRVIVFRGLQSQYIWYLGIGIVLLLLLFALLYIAGLPLMFCVVIVGVGGVLLFYYVYAFNNRYGTHGWMKRMAKRATPKFIYCNQLFVR